MATRKTTTKAKTKTAAARTNKAKTSTKASTTKTTRTSKIVSFAGLRKLHLLSVVVYALLLIAAVLVMNHNSVELTMAYLAKDTLLSGNPLMAAGRHLIDVQVRWLVVSLLVASLVLPLLYLVRWERYYQTVLKRGIVPLRWVEMALTSLIMAETIALLSGLQDLVTIKLFGFVFVILAVMSSLKEKHQLADKTLVKYDQLVLNLTKLFVVLLIGLTAVSTIVYGITATGWYVYALYAGLIAAFIAYPLAAGKNTGTRYNNTERNYLVLNLITRAGFAIILITGLMK